MDNPVDASDVQARAPRTLTADELRMAQALLDDGWEQLVSRVPSLVDRLTSGALRVGLVTAILREATLMVLLNPDGFAEESIDNWTGKRDASTSTGRLTFSDDDLSPLWPFRAGSAFEIVLSC